MEIFLDKNSIMEARGRVGLPIPANIPDSFIARIKRLLAVFAWMQEDYVKFFSKDKKILGQERASLRDHCDEMLNAAIGAIFQALIAANPEITNPEQEMTIPGEEKTFWVKRSGLLWHMRKKIRHDSASDIRTHLKVISEWPLRRLLERMRERAEDKEISPSELRELLPDVLDLAMQLMELRQHINGCGTSQ